MTTSWWLVGTTAWSRGLSPWWGSGGRWRSCGCPERPGPAVHPRGHPVDDDLDGGEHVLVAGLRLLGGVAGDDDVAVPALGVADLGREVTGAQADVQFVHV